MDEFEAAIHTLSMSDRAYRIWNTFLDMSVNGTPPYQIHEDVLLALAKLFPYSRREFAEALEELVDSKYASRKPYLPDDPDTCYFYEFTSAGRG